MSQESPRLLTLYRNDNINYYDVIITKFLNFSVFILCVCVWRKVVYKQIDRLVMNK